LWDLASNFGKGYDMFKYKKKDKKQYKDALLGYNKEGRPILDLHLLIQYYIEDSREEGETITYEHAHEFFVEGLKNNLFEFKKKELPILVYTDVSKPLNQPVVKQHDNLEAFMQEQFYKTLFMFNGKGIPEA
jgi:hypothetical protein